MLKHVFDKVVVHIEYQRLVSAKHRRIHAVHIVHLHHFLHTSAFLRNCQHRRNVLVLELLYLYGQIVLAACLLKECRKGILCSLQVFLRSLLNQVFCQICIDSQELVVLIALL